MRMWCGVDVDGERRAGGEERRGDMRRKRGGEGGVGGGVGRACVGLVWDLFWALCRACVGLV